MVSGFFFDGKKEIVRALPRDGLLEPADSLWDQAMPRGGPARPACGSWR